MVNSGDINTCNKNYHSVRSVGLDFIYNKSHVIFEFSLVLLYKLILECCLIPSYFSVWAYMFDGIVIEFDFAKSVISYVYLICLFLIYSIFNQRSAQHDFVFKMILYLTVVPSLALFSSVESISLLFGAYPCIYFLILSLLICVIPASKHHLSLKMKYIRNLDLAVLLIAFAFSFAFWVYLGFPITLDLSDTYDQRMSMRAISLPSIINYFYLMLGNAVVPYLFAKALMNKKTVLAIISLVTGILLFFSNGMKTWLVLYLIGLGVFVLFKFFRGNYTRIIIALEALFNIGILGAQFVFKAIGNNFLLGQLGRILVIPPRIGFQSIEFFSQPNHELLFLRESILKSFFETPYVGGSDFYINYGANSTLTSSRANNGLWGDAFRNFGFFGMIIYPILLVIIIQLVINSMKHQKENLQLFIILLLVWSSLNMSYFTWLLTGGIIILVLLLKNEDTSIAKNNTDIYAIGRKR